MVLHPDAFVSPDIVNRIRVNLMIKVPDKIIRINLEINLKKIQKLSLISTVNENIIVRKPILFSISLNFWLNGELYKKLFQDMVT